MKTEYSATIIKADGTRLETKDYDIKIRGVSIPSVDVEPEFEEVPGRSTLIHIGNKVTRDAIELDFDFIASDRGDFSLLRNEVFKLFHSRQPFYFIDPIEKGKRFLVMARGFRPEEVGTIGRSSVELVPVNAFAESIGTTAGPFTEEAGLWGYGMGLTRGINATDYIKTTGSFDIFNYGDFTVNPREHELIIEIVSKGGTATKIEINNAANGDKWIFDGTLANGNRITLDGINTEKNGVNADNLTNLGLIRLEPGANGITVTGITGSFEIRFAFRFLYN